MRALVTGGAGFIGSNLVDALVEGGADVLVADDLSTGRRENLTSALLAGANLRELDVRDHDAVHAAVREHRPEVVFHLAAQIDVRRSVSDPAFDADVNVGGTIGVLEAARREGVRRVVLSSTGGAIYGEADRLPTAESAPLRPLSPYGQAKQAAEAYCSLYERLHGLSSTVLRYANVYGPRQDPLGEGGVVAIFCLRLLSGRRPTVFGDGAQTRDYVYVGDVVAANLRAALSSATGVFNVGRGEQTSVLELARALRRLAPSESFEPEFAAARAGEVERSALDPSAIARALGWRPSVELERGLRRTLDWLASSRAGEALGWQHGATARLARRAA